MKENELIRKKGYFLKHNMEFFYSIWCTAKNDVDAKSIKDKISDDFVCVDNTIIDDNLKDCTFAVLVDSSDGMEFEIITYDDLIRHFTEIEIITR